MERKLGRIEERVRRKVTRRLFKPYQAPSSWTLSRCWRRPRFPHLVLVAHQFPRTEQISGADSLKIERPGALAPSVPRSRAEAMPVVHRKRAWSLLPWPGNGHRSGDRPRNEDVSRSINDDTKSRTPWEFDLAGTVRTWALFAVSRQPRRWDSMLHGFSAKLPASFRAASSGSSTRVRERGKANVESRHRLVLIIFIVEGAKMFSERSLSPNIGCCHDELVPEALSACPRRNTASRRAVLLGWLGPAAVDQPSEATPAAFRCLPPEAPSADTSMLAAHIILRHQGIDMDRPKYFSVASGPPSRTFIRCRVCRSSKKPRQPLLYHVGSRSHPRVSKTGGWDSGGRQSRWPGRYRARIPWVVHLGDGSWAGGT